MNTDQIGGVVRAVLAALGGFLVGKGILDSGTATTLAGALTTIIISVWSAWSNRPAGIVASAAALPSVAAVVTTKTAAGDIMSGAGSPDNVVAAGTTAAATLAK